LESVGNIPETSIRSIASQVLSALDDLHTKANTVYGALSPSQILIDKDGSIKVLIDEILSRVIVLNSSHWDLQIKFRILLVIQEL
jgi:serine/threonine protein kinase